MVTIVVDGTGAIGLRLDEPPGAPGIILLWFLVPSVLPVRGLTVRCLRLRRGGGG